MVHGYMFGRQNVLWGFIKLRQVFDFTNLTWSNLKLSPEPNAAESEEDTLLETFTATSGHHMLVWGNKVQTVVKHSPKVEVTDPVTKVQTVGQEKVWNYAIADSLPAEKKLTIFDEIFAAYHDARSSIRNDLATAGSAENVKDDLYGLDKAVSAVLGQRTIERNQLLVRIAKSKLTKSHDEKNEQVTKPDELVRLYDLLLQNVADLSDLVTTGRDIKQEEATFAEECTLKSSIF